MHPDATAAPIQSVPPASRLRSIMPSEEELARLLPPSLNGPVTFHGWAPVPEPVLIVRHLATNRIAYIGLDGREYRFKPFPEGGGQLMPKGAYGHSRSASR